MKKLKQKFQRLLFNLSPRTIKARVTYYKAVSDADKQYQTTGQRHYVLCDDDGKLVISSKESFFHLQKTKKIPPKITIKNLHINAIYYTQGRFKGYHNGEFRKYPQPAMKPLIRNRKLRMYLHFMHNKK